MATKKKLVSLEKFIEQHGTQRQAAAAIGVPEPTLNRWLNGALKPRGLSLRRLYEVGVDVREYGATDQDIAEFDAAATTR